MISAQITHPDDRLIELLADRALDGLSPDESREFDSLVAQAEPDLDLDAFDRAAAALSVALIQPHAQPIPPSLRTRLDTAAAAWTDATDASTPSIESPQRDTVGRITPQIGARATSLTPLGLLGWLAAAACLALAAILWTASSPDLLTTTPTALAEQRQRLIRSAPDLVRLPWTATDDPAASAGVEGEIVWSDALDKGFMTFRGLAPNDPTQSQYQLWIFDESRDERYPVDGGVFNIPSGSDTAIVEIDPRLPVDHATLFAVTVEKPGGVVVSSRERLPVLAQVTGG